MEYQYDNSNPGVRAVAKIASVGVCQKKRNRDRPKLVIKIVETKMVGREEADKGKVVAVLGRGQNQQLDQGSRKTFKSKDVAIASWKAYCDSGGFYGSLTLENG